MSLTIDPFASCVTRSLAPSVAYPRSGPVRSGRAMRDVLHRSKVLHPLMAAAAFEVWENLHKDDPSKPDDTLVTVTGLELPDGSIPEAKVRVSPRSGILIFCR